MGAGTSPVVVGVPTWCEAASIRDHACRVDEALFRAGFGVKGALIVNADNRSPDGTADEFMATATGHEKVVLTTDGRGKGRNCAALFEFALQVHARVLVTLDADLEVLPLDWLPALIAPVLHGSADLVTPLYPRFWYDANQTNQIAAPLFLATTGVAVRQPIGGDFAFSTEALRTLSALPWPEAAFGFGWDAFVVTTSLLEGLAVRQAPLSYGKIHSWRSDSAEEIEQEMELKFLQTTSVMLEQLASLEPKGTEPVPHYPHSPPPGCLPKPYNLEPIHEFARRCWSRNLRSPWLEALLPTGVQPGKEGLNDAQWAQVLTRSLLLARHEQLPRKFYQALQTLFFARLSSMLPAYANLSPREIDDIVRGVAGLIRQDLAAVSVKSDGGENL